MLWLCVILLTLLIVAMYKWFIFYCTTRGLLYYLATEHNDELDEKKACGIRDDAVRRVIRDAIASH